jgi:hypothetical protein
MGVVCAYTKISYSYAKISTRLLSSVSQWAVRRGSATDNFTISQLGACASTVTASLSLSPYLRPSISTAIPKLDSVEWRIRQWKQNHYPDSQLSLLTPLHTQGTPLT